MQKLRPYIPIVTRLIFDLLVMGYIIGRKVVLPSRRRKGNLLYSLFLLFTALTERLIAFKQAVTRTPLGFGKKYIRLALLLVTWGLCMLAAWEWAGSAGSTAGSAGSTAGSAGSAAPMAGSGVPMAGSAGSAAPMAGSGVPMAGSAGSAAPMVAMSVATRPTAAARAKVTVAVATVASTTVPAINGFCCDDRRIAFLHWLRFRSLRI